MLTILFYTLAKPGFFHLKALWSFFAELSIKRGLWIFLHIKYKLILISIPAFCHIEVLKGKVVRDKGPYAGKMKQL